MKVIFTVIFLALYAIKPVSGKCKPDEVEICADVDWQQCFCKTCISCPPGYGSSHQCGGRYVNGTIITCRQCISGVSYSEEYSIASCQPCQQCGGKKTLKKCTPKSETSCSTKCRVGYIMSHAVDQCLPDPSFVTTSPQINTAKLTASTNLPKTTTIPKTTISDTTTTQVGNTQRETRVTTKPVHLDTSGRNGLPLNSKGSDDSGDNKIILTVTGIAVVVFVICLAITVVIVVYFLYKRQVACFRCENARKQDEEMALTSNNKDSPSPRSSKVPNWPESLRLSNIPEVLHSDIANLISESPTVVNGWRAIGGDGQINLDQAELRAIQVEGKKQDTNQGLQLLIKLASCQPELTLCKFVNVLEKLGRKDVIETIRTYYNENKSNSVVQLNDVQINQADYV